MRKNKRGGGISVFLRNDIKGKVLTHLNFCCQYIESLVLEFVVGDTNVLLAVVYRPPQGDSNLFYDKLGEILSGIHSNKYTNIFLCGDFNYNLLDLNDLQCASFINLIRIQSLIPLISKPTRITENSATLIDNICVKSPINCTAGIIISDLSDHMPIFVLMEKMTNTVDTNCEKTIKYRVHNEVAIDSLCNSLENHDFSDIIYSADVNYSMERFEEVLLRLYRDFCPLKTKSISNRTYSKPWLSHTLLSYVKKKNNLYLLYRSGRVSGNSFSRYRNFVTSS